MSVFIRLAGAVLNHQKGVLVTIEAAWPLIASPVKHRESDKLT